MYLLIFSSFVVSKADYRVNPNHAVQLKVVLVGHRSIKNFNHVYDKIRDIVNGHHSHYSFGQKPFAYVKTGDREEHWGAIER